MPQTTAERFLDCFRHHRFDELAGLYADDAVVELHVGSHSELRTSPAVIAAQYAGDHDPPAAFLRWEAREAPWGAVVEGDAVQRSGSGEVRFRWVHVLAIEDDAIVRDTVYCTGAVPWQPPGP